MKIHIKIFSLLFSIYGLNAVAQANINNKKETKTLVRDANDKPNIILIYTDDHGFADMGVQGVLKDLKTPNVDALALSGVRATNGYSTAPQCVPSRAGLLSGRSQNKFGIESNASEWDLIKGQNIIPERLKKAGYVTAQFGKWHLGKANEIVDNGFDHIYPQNSGGKFFSNIDINGNDRPLAQYEPEGYHLETCGKAAASIIKRYKNDPFFLYVAFRAPHVPLDAPQKYEDRFPGKMPERRRKALAMLSAVDDSVGLIMKTLEEQNLLENTLVFYIADNGAPYKVYKKDDNGRGPGWDGSLNDPLNGEKGTLIEGGMHVPFLVSWKGTIPKGQVYTQPLSTLDVAATAVALAKLPEDKKLLDGVNIIPYLKGDIKGAPHDYLAWRWLAQSAIRQDKWKLLLIGGGGSDKEFLYDLDADISEKNNLIKKQPAIAKDLRKKLSDWSQNLEPKGLTASKGNGGVWWEYFQYYLNGIESPDLKKHMEEKTKNSD